MFLLRMILNFLMPDNMNKHDWIFATWSLKNYNKHNTAFTNTTPRNRNYTLTGFCKSQQAMHETCFEMLSTRSDCQLEVQLWGLSTSENTSVSVPCFTDVEGPRAGAEPGRHTALLLKQSTANSPSTFIIISEIRTHTSQVSLASSPPGLSCTMASQASQTCEASSRTRFPIQPHKLPVGMTTCLLPRKKFIRLLCRIKRRAQRTEENQRGTGIQHQGFRGYIKIQFYRSFRNRGKLNSQFKHGHL